MTHPLIECLHQDQVLTLNFLAQPPEGMRIDFVEALAQTLSDLPARSPVRIVVLRGDMGLNLDLAHWQSVLLAQPMRVHQALQQMHRWRTRTLKTLPQPLIAVVTGPCAGAALPLIEGCDLALCDGTATFSLSPAQADWLAPEGLEKSFHEAPRGPTGSLLPALAGQTLGAEQAQALGWVTMAVSEADLPQVLGSWTQSLLDKDPLALQFTKETLAHVPHMDWDASVSFTAAKFAEIKALQAAAGGASARAQAIAGFLAGQSKPGLKG